MARRSGRGVTARNWLVSTPLGMNQIPGPICACMRCFGRIRTPMARRKFVSLAM